MSLRTYQKAAIEAVVSHYHAGVRRQLIAMPTGSGKTVVFANLFSELSHFLSGQILVLAHREELIDQAADKIQSWNPTLSVGVEMAERHADPNSNLIVASVPTLGRKNSTRRNSFNWTNIRTCVVDEAHHATASTYKNIFEEGGFLAQDSSKLLLGVTATPNRSDGTPLAEIFEKIVYEYPLRQAIKDQWLCDITGIRVNSGQSLDDVKFRAGDFRQDELADAVNNLERNNLVTKAWIENAAGRQTVVFCVDIQHSLDLAATFIARGINAEAVWGDDPQRAEKLAAHRAGEITVITNCAVLTEGYDDSSISCIVLARPTASTLLFTQMIGRGTRLHPNKTDCLVIDVADNSSRHSLASLPSLFGMPAKLNLKRRSAIETLTELENAQREYPNIDISQLQDISQLKAAIERINLFEVEFPAEVKNHSALAWYPAMSGYVLQLPNRDTATIRQNMLGHWEIKAAIEGQTFTAEGESLENAFHAADKFILEKAQRSATLIKREGPKWHGDPASEKQLNLLTKLHPGKSFPKDLSKGSAARLISQHFAMSAR
jgi:superfamily II DNA or RNA helicase